MTAKSPDSILERSRLERARETISQYASYYRDASADGEFTVAVADGYATVAAELVPAPKTPEEAADNYHHYAGKAADGSLSDEQYAMLILQTSTYLVGFGNALHDAGVHDEKLHSAFELHAQQSHLHGALDAMDADPFTGDMAEDAARCLRVRLGGNTVQIARLIAETIDELRAG